MIALVAVTLMTAVAIVGWLRPVSATTKPPPSPTYTAQQVTDAKTKVCAAFETVQKGVSLTSNAPNPGNVLALGEALAANGRLALTAGSAYLLDQLQPATPQPLATEIRSFARLLLTLAVNYAAGAVDADPPQAALLHDGENDVAHIAELCK